MSVTLELQGQKCLKTRVEVIHNIQETSFLISTTEMPNWNLPLWGKKRNKIEKFFQDVFSQKDTKFTYH